MDGAGCSCPGSCTVNVVVAASWVPQLPVPAGRSIDIGISQSQSASRIAQDMRSESRGNATLDERARGAWVWVRVLVRELLVSLRTKPLQQYQYRHHEREAAGRGRQR